MKNTLLLFLSLISLSWCQEEPICRCGAFIDTPTGIVRVWAFPNFPIDACLDLIDCPANCTLQWNTMTNHGDLETMQENGITAGQSMCNYYELSYGESNLDPHDVFNYYQICNVPWTLDGMKSQTPLCCQNGVYPGSSGC